jgi:hypothetical protein
MVERALLASLPPKLGALILALQTLGCVPENIFPPSLQHNLIVGRPSQEGGLGTDPTSCNAGSSATSVFGHVSIIPPANLGVHIGSITEEESQVNDCAATEPRAACTGDVTARVEGLSIVSPTPGVLVPPGQPLTVTVEASSGFVPTRMLIYSSYGSAFVELPDPDGFYRGDVRVPPEAKGDISIGAFAFDASENLAQAADIVIQVDLSGVSLVGISVSPDMLFLLLPTLTQSLFVRGHYDDGVNRDLTTDASTTFVSAHPTIATVDADGLVTGHTVGVGRIDVANGAHTAFAVANVGDVRLDLRVDEAPSLSWPRKAGAIGYDVVRGDLSLLHSSDGDFAAATEECLADDFDQNSLLIDQLINPGDKQWFVVRPVYLADSGTYDTEDWWPVSQVGQRDVEIDGSPEACP